MGKVKKGTIFKIFIVTLLIILSTMNLSYAFESYIQIVPTTRADESSYDGANYDLGEGDEILDIDFDDLENHSNGVFCNEQGHELRYKTNNPAWGEIIEFGQNADGSTFGTVYPEDITSGYKYTYSGTYTPTPTEAYIFAHIPNEDIVSHWSRASQWAWWAHGSASLARNSESSSTAYNTSNQRNILEQLMEGTQIAVNNIKLDIVWSEIEVDLNILANNGVITISQRDEIQNKIDEYKNTLTPIELYSEITLETSELYVELTSEQQQAFLEIIVEAIDNVEAMQNSPDATAQLWLQIEAEILLLQTITSEQSEKLLQIIDENKAILTPFELYLKIIDEEEPLELNLSDEAKEDILQIILNESKTIYGEDSELANKEDGTQNGISLLQEALAFGKYAEMYLTEDGGSLKSDVETKINSENLSVMFDQEENNWLIGPMTLEYPNFVYNGIRFAGIKEVNLTGLYKDGTAKLTYVHNADISSLQPSQYTFVTKDGEHFIDNDGYPTPRDEFYIVIEYDENLQQITNFNFKNDYMLYESEDYKFYKSEYYYHRYNWETIFEVEFTDYKVTKTWEEKLADGTTEEYSNSSFWEAEQLDDPVIEIPGYTTADNIENIMYTHAVNPNPVTNQGWSYNGAYYSVNAAYASKTQLLWWKCVGTPTPVYSDPQDLVVSGAAKVWFEEDGAEVEIPWEKTIELTKIVVDINGNEINSDQEFNYMVIMDFVGKELYEKFGNKMVTLDGKDYLVVNEGTITAGTTRTVTLPPIYLSDFDGVYPEYYVIETDQYGNFYSEWQNSDSLWTKYVPKDSDEDGIETGDKIEFINQKQEEHSHLKIDKKIKAENADGTAVCFEVKYTYEDGSSISKIIELIPDSNSTWFETTFKDGTPAGYIQTGVEDGYAFAKFISYPIEWKGEVAPRYSVIEVDENGLSYEKYTDLSNEAKNLEGEIKAIEKELSGIIYDNLSEQEKAQYNSKLNTLHRKTEELETKKVTLHNSIWNKFEDPVTNNTSGSFKDYVCGCDGSKTEEALNVATTAVASFKNSLGPTEFSLTVEKRNKNVTAQYEAKFNVDLQGYDWEKITDENPASSATSQYIDTLVVTSDSGETDTASGTINNPRENYKYFITVTEQESDYKWIDYIFDRNETKENVYVLQDGDIIKTAANNPDKWILRIEDGTIIEATKVLIDNAENNLSLVAINNGLERYTGLVIDKTVVDTSNNIDYEKYPEAFYFKLQKHEHGGYKDWDAVKDLFVGNLVETDNGTIIKVTRNEFDEYKLASYIIPLSVNVNPKEAIPTIKLIEVDQYGEEYSENPTNDDSIWNGYIPLTTEVTKGLNVYTTQEAAETAKADNTLTVMSQQNAKIYSGTIEITKALPEGTEWEDDAKFYFTIDVLNDSMDCESIVKEYFDDEFIAENGEKGYHGSKPVVVITKENQTVKSNLIEWESNLENPKFVIREVDQYGCSWHGSEDKIENEDSTWYDYQPSGKNKYNTVTAQILPGENVEYSVTFENAPQLGTIRINKVISNSEFLEEEKFYFKVEENGKDVTADLFDVDENGYVVVTYAQKDTGITSKEQIGKHTYTITEYDDKGVTYEEYKDGTSSEFWGTGFIPSNNGVWTVDLNSSDGPSFIEAINYRVVDLEVIKEITGDITEEDRNQEFSADLVIAPRSTTGDIWVKDSNGEFKSYEYGYIDRITLSANNPYTLEGIAWEGDSPYCFVSEIDLPEGWTLVGYEPSNIDLNADSSLNKLKIINKKETEMTLQITKNIVDLNGKIITLEQDSPKFYFDVLAKNLQAGDTILIDGVETVVDGTQVDDEYTRLTNLEIVVPAGENSKTVTIQGINGNNLDYKVIEVDQHGEEYSNNPTHDDSIWHKTKPTVYSNGKLGNIDGIWAGTISNEDGAPLVAKIDAYNAIRKVDINFTKMVKDEDGKISEIEPGEVFYYIAEFSNSTEKENFTITYDETTKGATTWHKEFILDLDETLTYTITEVDKDDITYEEYKSGKTSVFWDSFKPTDGDGVIGNTVEPNTNPELWLVGMNTPRDMVYGELKLTKTAESSGEQEFYFIVEQNGKGNVVTSLFEESIITYIGENKDIPAVALKAGEEVYSKVQTWKDDENAPTFTVKEVDQYGQTYLFFTELKEDRQEDSLWNNWTPTNDNGKDVTLIPAYDQQQLEATEEDMLEDGVTIQEATEVTIFNETNIKVQPFEIIKKVDNSPIADGENFYFIITKDGNQVTGEELEELFPGADIVENKIHLYKTSEKTVDSATSISVDITNHKYVVIEVDASGAQYSTTPAEDSLWNEYSVENGGKWEVTEEQPEIIVNNEKIDENKATILIKKQLLTGQEWQEGKAFSFTIYKNGAEYKTITLSVDHQSEKLEFTWKGNEEAPKIGVKENDFTPKSITLDGSLYDPSPDSEGIPTVTLVPDNAHKYTFAFENDITPEYESGYLNVTKKMDDGSTTDQTFTFNYYYNDNDEDIKTLTIKPGQTKPTEEIQWLKGTSAPTFKIWEVDGNPVSITGDGIEYVYDGDTLIGATGTLSAGSNGTVNVEFVNTWDYEGSLNVIKTFSTPEKISIEQILSEVATVYGENYNFTFTLSVEPGDADSVFNYNGTPYSDKQTIATKTISISEFINNYESASKIFENITVQWSEGSRAPKYTVIEENTGTFWVGTISDNSASNFIDGETIEVTINNVYGMTEKWDLTTKMAGIVWNDGIVDNKQVIENIEGGADGRYLPDVEVNGVKDELMSDVYVRIARVLLKNGNEIDRTYNDETQFILDTTNEYYYITDGHWHFDKVSVPAFTKAEIEQGITFDEGYRIKYDVEFFYDGVTYQPTDLLVIEEEGQLVSKTANDYINDSDNEQYFISSSAIDDLDYRIEFNKKYSTLTGNTLMDSKGNSTGKLGDADVNYEGNIEFESASELYTNIAKGTVDLGITSDNYDTKLMKATTGNSGLTYFFEGEMGVDTNADGEIDSWQTGEGQLIELTPGNCEFYENREVLPDCVVMNKHYRKIYDYALNINLGLVEKPQVDLELEKKIVAATIIVNEKAQVYPLNSDINEDIIYLEKLTKDQQKELENLFMKLQYEEEKFNIYTSDYNYRVAEYAGTEVADAYDKFYKALYGYGDEVEDLIKTKELQIYLTYGLSITNKSGIYDVEIATIDDYSESSLEYVDVKSGYIADYYGQTLEYNPEDPDSGLWAYIGEADGTAGLTDIFADYKFLKDNSFITDNYEEKGSAGSVIYGDVEYSFNKATISVNEIIAANSRKTYYTTYRVNRYDISENGLILGVKPNIAEITEFTTYYNNNYSTNELGYDESERVLASTIDKDSAPGNYNFTDYPNCFEDDTDFAQVNIIGTNEVQRTLSGTAWLDVENSENDFNGQILGDSKFVEGEDYSIADINTQLVEVIDIPVVEDRDGDGVEEITSDYDEYEFYWDSAATSTIEDGSYTLNSMTMNSINYNGLVPGNYVVRFFYGDQDTRLYKLTNAVENENGEIEKTFEENTELPRINGIDYKTTSYEKDKEDVNNCELSNYIDNEWQKDIYNEEQKTIYNEARDNEARRLKLIKETQELNNKKTATMDIANYANIDEYVDDKVAEYAATMSILVDEVSDAKIREFGVDYIRYKESLYGTIYKENGATAYNGIIYTDGYSMFADTAKLNLKVEKEKSLDEPDGYEIEGINLGLEERSKTEIYLDKQIKAITLTTSSDKTFFHIEYDVEYSTEGGNGWNQVDDGLYVKLTVKEDSVIGENNLQTLNDNWTLDSITQGFRYINIDSTVLQGLKLEIKYQITAINLSETDMYGTGLNAIMAGKENFDNAIEQLSSHEYTLYYANIDDGRLYRRGTEEYKSYGQYLGHTYYQGLKSDDTAWEDEYVVTTTVREIVDYIDNDIEVYTDLINENGQMWDVYGNDSSELKTKLDTHVYIDGNILDDSEDPYSTILVSADSKEANSIFVKELTPEDYVKETGEEKDTEATISLTTSKIFASTDEGETGMDNFAEILMIENTVGRRDMDTVYGNYNPRGGATQTTERDETATEIVTLSPPTGNIENDRAMITYIAILSVISVLTGAGVGIKLKKSEKSSKSDKTE